MTAPSPLPSRQLDPIFYQLFQSCGLGIAILDLQGRFCDANPALLQTVGYTREELIGLNIASISIPDERLCWSDLFRENSLGQREWRMGRKNGTVFWARATFTLMHPDRQTYAAVIENVQAQHEELEALHESEERFRLMVEGSDEVFFFQHGTDQRLTYVSPSIRKVTGFEPHEVVGKPITDFMADRESIRLIAGGTEPVSQNIDRREPFVVEGIHKNGSRITVEVLESLTLDASGGLTVRGLARDITAKRLVEQQLELSDQILRRINAVVLVANGMGQIIYVSPSTTRLLGFSAAELLGYGWWRHEGQSGDRQRQACELVASAARGERPCRDEVWEEVTYDKDGVPHWLLWQEAKGPADLLIGIAQDITDKKKVDEELSRRSVQLRAIFESVVDGLFIVNDEIRYVDVNPAGCALLGRTREEIVGRNVGDFSPANSIPFDLWEKVRTEGAFVGKHQVVRADGTRLEVEISVKANILPGLHLSMLRDVTDRKRLERQFMQSQKMEALGRLAGGVAHDVNNMLTQMSAASNVSSTYQDGFSSGSLLDFNIGSDGVIQGSFTNGTKILGQLALANFANLQGLKREGHNCFGATLASGQAVIGAPGTGGRGTLAGGALELSNVDIAREFASLIMAQRGFQANARAITAFDEITQETINLKR